MKKIIFYKSIFSLILTTFLSHSEVKAQELHTQSNAASISNESNSTSGWIGNSNSLSISSDAYSGNYSFKVEGNTSSYFRGEYSFNVEIGEEYIIRIYAKSDSQTQPGFWSWEGFSNFSGREITSNVWEEYVFNLVASQVNAKIKIYSALGGAPNDKTFFDNVSISKVGTLPDPNTGGSGPSVWTSGTDSAISYNEGNVGIGTSNPQSTFQINTVRPILFKNNGSQGIYGSEIGFNATLNTYVVPNTFTKLGNTEQFGGAVQTVDYRGNMHFQMYNAESKDEATLNYLPQVTFTNSGSVGIGTATPGTWKLAVNGKVRAKEIKVEIANWPDYVFTEEYKLPTLEELAQQIKEKGHLPNIPSAQEVKENGIELGEMNKLLLEKIEELTLYILAQENRLLKLEKAILQSNKK